MTSVKHEIMNYSGLTSAKTCDHGVKPASHRIVSPSCVSASLQGWTERSVGFGREHFTTLQLVLQHEDEEQEQHEQIADGVEGTPDGTAQQHGGSSSAHGGQQVGDGAAGLYVVLPANLGGPERQRLTSGAGDTTVAAGENEDAADMQGGATGAEAGAEPSGRQGPGHGGGVAGDGAALPPGRHPKHGDG